MNLLKDKTVLIVGLGLIGGSIARGLASTGSCRRILAVGRDETPLQTAVLDGSIHAWSTDLATLAPEADLIMITVPTLAVRGVLQELAELVDDHVIITDAASVKGKVVADARQILAGSIARFVPGHPIAGSEQSGYQASRADLYKGRKVILTPMPDNDTSAVRTVMSLWQHLGAEVRAMSVDRHDTVLAGTSHLPHLLAYTLVNTLVDSISEPDRVQQVFDYAAGGFADFSRIASSDPRMWRDIFLANTQATVDVLDSYIAALQQMRTLLLRADGSTMEAEFCRAKQVRDDFIHRFRSGITSAETGAAPAPLNATTERSVLVGRPGFSLQGDYRPPAEPRAACAALQSAALRAGVTQIGGVPEDAVTLAYIQRMRDNGVPIIGPEAGRVSVYGESTGPGPDPDASAPVSAGDRNELGADDFLVAALVLAATVVPASTLTLKAVRADSEVLTAVLSWFGDLGASMEMLEEGVYCTLLVRSAELTASSEIVPSIQCEQPTLLDDLTCLQLATGLLAQGSTRLKVADLQSRTRVLHCCQTWISLGADIELHENDMIIVRHSELKSDSEPLELNDAPLVLLTAILAQRASAHIRLTGVEALALAYPGLLSRLQELGFGLNVEAVVEG